MESYIVRIYRRNQGDSGELAGLVETVGTSERLPFRSLPELTSVLHRMLEHDSDEAFAGQQKNSKISQPDRVSLNLVAGLEG